MTFASDGVLNKMKVAPAAKNLGKKTDGRSDVAWKITNDFLQSNQNNKTFVAILDERPCTLSLK